MSGDWPGPDLETCRGAFEAQPDVVACGGPTLRDLREASVDVMLEPFRQQIASITDEVVAAIEQAAAIVRDLSNADPCSDAEFDAAAGPCVFCGAESVGIDRSPDGLGGDEGRIPALLDDHTDTCPYRRAVEWVAGQGGDTEGDPG